MNGHNPYLPRKKYKPGDTFSWGGGQYEVVAVDDDDNGCTGCFGRLHTDICDALPAGCADDTVVWRPRSDTAKLLLVTLKLEGKTIDD
jgi:hypothetical protein